MGFGLPELIIVFVIVILVFGTKKLRSLGGDLGSAIKSFRSAIKEDESEETRETNREISKEDRETEDKQDPEK